MDPLHGRNYFDEVIQLTGAQNPACADVARQYQRLVLGQNKNPANAGVDAIG
jgi:hypothetical protein